MTERWDTARREAKRLLAGVDPDLVIRLAEDTFDCLRAESFVVRLRPEEASSDRCSVAGSYSAGPPATITVAESLSIRRRCFSALHEYGHHLIRLDKPIHDLFFDHADGGVGLEEDVCDAVAAELLLPDSLVDRFIGNRGPSARSVFELFNEGGASREAACVRAAQRLLGDGYIILGEGSVARFTASVSSYRIARNVDQGPDSILAQASRRGTARGKAHPLFRTGNEGPQLFADAVSAGGYVFTVLTDSPAWEDFTVRDKDDIFEEHEGSCLSCEIDFTTRKAPCPSCGQPLCWKCGGCWCGVGVKVKERFCTECTMIRPLNLFDADSTICCDCA
jgi:Zn-dependent peptidase ImmA (M78 family)